MQIMYMNLPCNAFQTTLATYTGQNIGAGKPHRVKTGTMQAAIYCNSHLKAIALVNIILAMYIPLFGVFQGSNHGAAATVVVTFALLIRVFTTYFFRYSDIFGYTIIWWNGLFGFGTGLIITWSYYLSNKWQKNSAV